MTFQQKILLFFIEFPIKILWIIDNILIEPVLQIFRGLSVGILTAVDLIFISFMFYAFLSGQAESYINGIVVTKYPITYQQNFGMVLGEAKKSDYPELSNEIPLPEISAKVVFVSDMNTEKVLYEKDADIRYAPASTTKLMTALVSDEIYDMTDEVEIKGACTLVDSTKAFLPVGKKFTVSGLMHALLIASAGDAACALSSGNIEYINFIDRMNTYAKDLGMENTHFTNPVGLDDPDKDHYSTAKDLYKLAKASMKNETIKELVKKSYYTLYSVDEEVSAGLTNTNKLLLEVPNSVGIKTGTTEEAGEVLIYNYVDEPKNIVIIVLGSEDRFIDTKALLDWVLVSYSWE